ncbi:MAG: hypothetical protein WD063_14115 [Pirellulales bacterium]
MARTCPTLIIVAGLFLAWHAVLVADEPGGPVRDAARQLATPDGPREYMVAIRFIEAKTLYSAPRVRVRDGQTANVLDHTQTPFVIGETVALGIKSPAIRVVTEGVSIDVKVTGTEALDQVLLDLAAERQKIDKVAENGPYQSVRTGSVKKQVLERVRLGEKTRVDFPDRQLEIIVTAAD